MNKASATESRKIEDNFKSTTVEVVMIAMKFVLVASHKLIFYVVQISIIDMDMLLD